MKLLDLARFRELADAYGGAIARWPEVSRAAAARIASTAEGAAILARASLLDEQLDAWRTPAPSPDLSARIAAGRPVRSTGMLRGARLWWSGAGIAAALAGAVAGAAGTAAVAAVMPADLVADGSTSFGDLSEAGEDR